MKRHAKSKKITAFMMALLLIIGGTFAYAFAESDADQSEENPETSETCAHENTVVDEAVEPTCTETGLTEGSHCTDCGEVLVAQEEVAALGHDYEDVVTDATCTESGYTVYPCTGCGDTYTGDETSAIGHWYGLWTTNEDGTHSATCKRTDCDYEATIDCAQAIVDGETVGMEYTVTISDELLSYCPVCGVLGEVELEEEDEAEIEEVDDDAIPTRGELIVHAGAEPYDGVLYAVTAAYEYSGKVIPFEGTVSVSVPLELDDDFRVVRVDVTEATDTTERSEEWTTITYTCEDGILSFETDAEGLFLIIAAE